LTLPDRHLTQKIAHRSRLAQVMILSQQSIKSFLILRLDHFDSQTIPVVGTAPTTPLFYWRDSFHRLYYNGNRLFCLLEHGCPSLLPQIGPSEETVAREDMINPRLEATNEMRESCEI
jgi:hypothetical protein